MRPRCARHPAPARAACARCGDHLCAACLAEGCGESGCPQEGAWDRLRRPVPWERAPELGRLHALVRTVVRCLLGPVRFFAGLAAAPGRPHLPLLYGVLVSSLGMAGGMVFLLLGRPALRSPLVLPVLLALPFALGLRLLLVAGLGEVGLRALGERVEAGRVLAVCGYAATWDLVWALPWPLSATGTTLEALWRALGFRVALGVSWPAAIVAASLPLVVVGLGVLGGVAAWIQFGL